MLKNTQQIFYSIHNLFTSKLEKLTGLEVPGPPPSAPSPIRDATPPLNALNAASLDSRGAVAVDPSEGPLGPTAASDETSSLRPLHLRLC